MTKFLFLTDLHWGYERRGGHKVALHDEKAINAALAFAQDFKPDVVILGGDTLDCGAISHHNKNKPGRTEGLKLLVDAEECSQKVIKPLEALKPQQLIVIEGNHEAWLEDLIDDNPGLEGIVTLQRLLHLDKWKFIPQGGHFNLGKLTFIHGDQLKGGEHVAKAAVVNYERSVRFGHHHSAQLYTKNTAFDYKNGKTGMAVPCLCTKNPKYGEGASNRWAQGFLWGYVGKGGYFNDYLTIITDGSCIVNGKVYKG